MTDSDIAWALGLLVILIKAPWLDSPLHWDEIDVYSMPVLRLHRAGLGLIDNPENFGHNPFGAQLISYFLVQILGFAPWVLKFQALLGSAVSTGLLYLIGRQYLSRYPSTLACMCFIFNPSQFYLSDRYLGEVLALPFLMAFVYFYLTKKKYLAAVFASSLGWFRQTMIAFSVFICALRRPHGFKDWATVLLPVLSTLSFFAYLRYFSGDILAHQTFAEGRFNWTNFLGHGIKNAARLTFYAQGKWAISGLFVIGTAFFYRQPHKIISASTKFFLGTGLVCIQFILFLAFDNGAILRYYQLILPFQVLAVFLVIRPQKLASLAASLILVVGFTYYWQIDDGFPQESLQTYHRVTELSKQMGWYLDISRPEEEILTGWPFPNMFRVPQIGYVSVIHPVSGYDEIHYYSLPESGNQRDDYLKSLNFKYILSGSLTDSVIRDFANNLLATGHLESVKRFQSGDHYIELLRKTDLTFD